MHRQRFSSEGLQKIQNFGENTGEFFTLLIKNSSILGSRVPIVPSPSRGRARERGFGGKYL